MNDQFDELTKDLVQSVTRRRALKKFGFGIVAIALTSLGLTHQAHAAKSFHCQCRKYQYGCPQDENLAYCLSACTYSCQKRQI